MEYKKNKTKLYVLYGNKTLKIRYIGITNKSLQKRLSGHINDAIYNTTNPHKCHWINKMIKEEGGIGIRCIGLFDTRYEAEKMENFLIEKYKISHKLLNCLDLGRFRKLKKPSESLRAKKIHVYNLNGNYLQSFNSVKETADFFNVDRHSISKVLTGKKDCCKERMFSYYKKKKINSILTIKQPFRDSFIILDNKTNKEYNINGFSYFIKILEINISKVEDLPKYLNKHYGNRFSINIKGKWLTSVYYNNYVIITLKNGSNIIYSSILDLCKSINIKIEYREKYLIDKINKKIPNIKSIEFKKPIPEVIQERKLVKLLESL